MDEQTRADLFSEQVDHLLRGESPIPTPPGDEGLGDLLTLANELSQVSFEPSPAAQTAFESQLESWFGPRASGPRFGTGPKDGRRNTMSGKLIALIVSILVTVTTGAVAVVVTILVVIRTVIPGAPPAAPALTSTPVVTETTSPVPSLTSTSVPTETVTATLVPSATIPSSIDTIDAITVVVTIEVEIDNLVPGLAPHDGGGRDDDDDDDDYHDHNRGHGNDPDHHDDDNPGRSHDDDDDDDDD